MKDHKGSIKGPLGGPGTYTYTLNLPETPNPKPSTLNPKPLNSKPSTLNPPYTLRSFQASARLLTPGAQDKTVGISDGSAEGALGLNPKP